MIPRTCPRSAVRTLQRRPHPNRISIAPKIPTLQSHRYASRLASLSQSNSRISTVFGALIFLGVASTAYGVYEFYQTFTIWPKEVRGDLRAGVKAKNQENYDLSERYLRRALETAQSLPLEQLSPQPYLKLSGIAVVLGEVLEKKNRPQAAYEVYTTALTQLQTSTGLSGPERMRAAAIAFKLGELAETYQQPAEEEEKWLVYAVEELLRILRDTQSSTKGLLLNSSTTGGPDGQLMLSELELPSWVTINDVVAPLETLGSFYNRVGKQEYSVPLYLSALSILMPPASNQASVEARCKGAHIMNSLANSLIQESSTSQRRDQAEAWVKKALAVIQDAKSSAKDDPEAVEECDFVLASTLFNMGSFREMAGDMQDARKWYTESREQSVAIKMREGVLESDLALRRLDRLNRAKSNGGSIQNVK